MLVENIENIKNKIRLSCEQVGRSPDEITLVAVTKTISPIKIKEAYDYGLRDFGENKVQDMIIKTDQLPQDIKWHFVGHLQKNKIKYIKKFIHLIHSVDSMDLAEEINKHAKGINRIIPVLLQINTSNEESKFGMDPKVAIDLTKKISELRNLSIKGLMTIGLLTEKAEEVRPCFILLREIRDEIKSLNLKNVEMKHLSMGMTNDFEVAIEEGATIIRIGTAIFGERKYN